MSPDSDIECNVADDSTDNIDVLEDDDEEDDTLMVDGDRELSDNTSSLHSPLEGPAAAVHNSLQVAALRDGHSSPRIGQFKF